MTDITANQHDLFHSMNKGICLLWHTTNIELSWMFESNFSYLSWHCLFLISWMPISLNVTVWQRTTLLLQNYSHHTAEVVGRPPNCKWWNNLINDHSFRAFDFCSYSSAFIPSGYGKSVDNSRLEYFENWLTVEWIQEKGGSQISLLNYKWVQFQAVIFIIRFLERC